jgi:Ca2+-dependent lipid-binding protein
MQVFLGSKYKVFLSQVAWLNKALTRMWPQINKAGAKLLTETVTPILEMYKPAVLEKMKIEKLTLGNVAPEITGESLPRLLELKPVTLVLRL